jgi:hypothetical protein
MSPHRQRNKNSQISHKHGSATIGLLRKVYGQSFASGLSPTTTLYEALELFGPNAVSELHLKMIQQDYDDGSLQRKIKKVEHK